ncbi:unnamed protein product [Paramecium pentaurelia]|uniref:Uncharacterized protein n=1 Tax=Paramecium pentaurelia TaxID=43138 RepID=A0A8S1T980_9CILI|nr:unnamed protein product [Paramecium pentaurelia]
MIYDKEYQYKFVGNQSHFSFMVFDDDKIQEDSILKYFRCNGKQGLALIIDLNTIFRSTYLSLQAKFQI